MFIGHVSVYHDSSSDYWRNGIYALECLSREEALSQLRAIANEAIAWQKSFHSSFYVEVSLSAKEVKPGEACQYLFSLIDDDENFVITSQGE